MVQKKINFKNKLLKYFPLILLYFSVLNEFDIDVSILVCSHLTCPSL